MKPYEDPDHAGNDARYHTGQACIGRGWPKRVFVSKGDWDLLLDHHEREHGGGAMTWPKQVVVSEEALARLKVAVGDASFSGEYQRVIDLWLDALPSAEPERRPVLDEAEWERFHARLRDTVSSGSIMWDDWRRWLENVYRVKPERRTCAGCKYWHHRVGVDLSLCEIPEDVIGRTAIRPWDDRWDPTEAACPAWEAGEEKREQGDDDGK